MTWVSRITLSGVLACVTAVGAGTTQQEPPIPVVTRTAAPQDAFDRPSLLVFVRITKLTQDERGSDEPGSQFNSVRRRPVVESAEARVLDVLRINERKPDEPGLEQRFLTVFDAAGGAMVRRLEIGQLYVLPLDTTPEHLRLWRPYVDACPFLPPPPGYALASPQGGYKLTAGAAYDTTGRRLRVLKRGGPLDIYDGLLFDDVEKKLRNWPGF